MRGKRIIGVAFLILSIIFIGLYFGQNRLTSTILKRNQNTEILSQVTQEMIEENLSRDVPNHNEDIVPLDINYVVRETLFSNRDDSVDESVIDEAQASRGEFTEIDVTLVDSDDDINNLSRPAIDDNVFQNYMIGQIVIPSRYTNLGILKGATNETLLRGAGTMKLDQSMGEGNYALAGHYQAVEGVLFNAVYDMAIGTKVYITDKKTVYEYEIYDHRIEPETSVELLDDALAFERGNPILTLMTCPINASQGTRVFAFGDLVNSFPYEAGMFESADTFTVVE